MFDVNKIRADFPILERKIGGAPLVYLDSAATSQKPKRVLDAIADFYTKHNANIHRGVHTLSAEATTMVDEAREKVAKFINAKTDEVIFVRNATEGLNLVAYAWARQSLKKNDVVVISLLEHHSNMVPWQIICEEVGAHLHVIEVDDEGRLLLTGTGTTQLTGGKLVVTTGSLESLLDERVKLVAVTAVSNVLGTITPTEEIKKLIKKKSPSAKLLVDGAQMVPHMKTDVTKLGADFMAFSGHKMLGPTGSGVLWGKREILESMKPFLYGGDMIGEVRLTGTTWSGLPNKFEAGTPDIAGIIGLGTAIDYLTSLGMDNIREHEKELIGYALGKMEKFEKKGLVEVFGPRNADERGGVLTFNVKGVHAHDAAQVLDKYGIAVRSGQHCGAPIVERFKTLAMARASFYVYTTKGEIDFLIEKIKEVPKVFSL
ncbi:cysteine desulfurase [Candidatus Collierbacteria bacterium RIFCSPLOWO2_01_FULL_50_23]|uniref:cysteine desulfurase n=2 Tax=Candidatus Collieribacteriota TaxID=1752725 RepID=A0A1F5EWR9_9BACT|nr:MAG: cysteine desulfurase [Candidatus Collierbacteria bacterium RIFCSPHIGHO2_01_FULL_50_25]OGD71853.1 MAG: cysteine desulfurase [Candidatus Collierbacteria bacterium RIFCSPHIGHO2_02_FULL_49_10]OGD74438.1 MAG: cysteine desulfurase [Candidatus Collierbacteria bacterium RIFCSPLOWO2_01_FULL_50_23]